MRPILVQLPSKLLFIAACVLAAGLFVADCLKHRRNSSHPWSSTPLYLLGAAWLLLGQKSGAWLPTGHGLALPWAPVPIFSYGVMLGTSMIIGWFLAMRLATRDGIAHDQAGTIYMWTALWSIIGARVLYVIVQWREFDSVLEMAMVNRGGLVAYGGMIGGFLASWHGCHKRKIPLLQWADVSAPSVVLGTAITRVGCLLFGCDYGKRTDLPWAIRFPGPNAMNPQGSPAWRDHVDNFGLARDAARSFPIHPTQVYEMLAGLFLFGLMMLVRRKRTFSGQAFLVWVIGYGTLRPIIEIFRDDDQRGTVGPFSTSQFIGIVGVTLGLALLASLVKRHRADPAALRLWELAPTPEPVTAPGGKRGKNR